MIRVLSAVALCLIAGPAYAQISGVEGNWGCRALIDGTKAAFKDYEGKVVLIVNTASRCGVCG